MSRVAASGGEAAGGVRVAAAMAFVLGMSIVVVLLVRARPAPEPFDPRSGRPDGTRGLVLTLEEFGVTVDVSRSVPGGPDGVVLVLADRLDDGQRNDLLDAVEAGASVVVADPDSSLHGGSGFDGGAVEVEGTELPERRLDVAAEANLAPGDCTIAALASLRGVYVAEGRLFPVGPSEPSCFTDDGTSFVIVRSIGAGTVTGLGDNGFLTNRHLRRADNAAFAVALLTAPGGPSADARVTVLLGNGAAPTIDELGTGDETLADLVPTWVWISLAAFALGVVVFAASRAVRVGRIVTEPVATPVEGSEFVAATGNLMQRAGHAERAGRLLLVRLHADLCRAHRLGPDATAEEVDAVVASRHGRAPGEVMAVLSERAHDDASLVRLAERVAALRRDVLSADPPPSAAASPPVPRERV